MNASPLVRMDETCKVLSFAQFSLATSVFNWESILGIRVWQILVQHHREKKKKSDSFKGKKKKNLKISWAGRDNSNPTPGPVQNPKNPMCLRVLPKCFFNSGSLGAMDLVFYFLFIPNLWNSFSNTGTMGGLTCWKCIVRSEQWIIRKKDWVK